MFANFDTFWSWFIKQVEKDSPLYSQKPIGLPKPLLDAAKGMWINSMHSSLPIISQEELSLLFEKIRGIVNFPRKIRLVYEHTLPTFASWYNKRDNQIEILLPTVFKYMLEYPAVIETVIKHELGHIFNRDIFLNTDIKHKTCSNICQDVRINAQLNRESLREVTSILCFDKDISIDDTPHPISFFPKLGLPLEGSGVFDWETIHDFYHLSDETSKQQDETMKALEDILKGLQEQNKQADGKEGQKGQQQQGQGQQSQQQGQSGQQQGQGNGQGQSSNQQGQSGNKDSGQGQPSNQQGQGSGSGQQSQQKTEEGDKQGQGNGQGKEEEKNDTKTGEGDSSGKKGEPSDIDKKIEKKKLEKEIDRTINSLNVLKTKFSDKLDSGKISFIDGKIKELNEIRQENAI